MLPGTCRRTPDLARREAATGPGRLAASPRPAPLHSQGSDVGPPWRAPSPAVGRRAGPRRARGFPRDDTAHDARGPPAGDRPAIWWLTFIAPPGLECHPSTRTSVGLLGPCFKTGQVGDRFTVARVSSGEPPRSVCQTTTSEPARSSPRPREGPRLPIRARPSADSPAARDVLLKGEK